ncbi:MAG TPA: hypothetical protein VFF69_06440, partial [Phycisphaerales bacterium]|nr:hypothetical protein [Phycisphaerales bacterium]
MPEPQRRDFPAGDPRGAGLGTPEWGRPLPWLDAWWVSPRWVEEAFEAQRAIDPVGHRVQLWLGALACFCLGGPTTAAEIGALPLLAASLIRVHRHWRTWGQFFLQPLFLAVLAWVVLGLASYGWTGGSGWDWFQEFGVARFVVMAVALWAVSDRRAVLLAALVLGFLFGELSQVWHGVGATLGADWMT